jgi:hypothetical protein
MRREETNAKIMVMKMNVNGEKRRGRSKNRWLDLIENDMKAIDMCVENRDEWRFRTRVVE